MAKNTVTKIQENIPVKRVLVSVSNKNGLVHFVRALLEASPEVLLYSSGGTYKAISEFLGDEVAAKHLVSVEKFTGELEMQGGLVKTLTPAIHGGILGERFNTAHQEYLAEKASDYFDMVVVNLYPFEEVINQPDCSYETARGNIDIGGPTMIRGAAKNWLGCAVVHSPFSYEDVLVNISANGGCTTPEMRFVLKQAAFLDSAKYETAIANYMASQRFEDVIREYELV